MNKDKSRHINSYKKPGMNIRNIRTYKKLSQKELAFRISSAKNYIGCIERFEKFPSLAILMDIASALNCKIKIWYLIYSFYKQD